MRQRSLRALGVAALGFALRVQPALACAVCFDQNVERRAAFLGTTILLSLLPLGMFGSLVWWLRRRWLAATAADVAASGHDSDER